jgi:hypothetical protein
MVGQAMHARMPLGRNLIIAAALLARASVVGGAWMVGADGTCVEHWAPSDLLRGPAAIADGPLLPVRTLAGGAQYAWNTPEWWPWQIGVLGPAVTLVSGAGGMVEGLWWVGTGVADTLTGGYFAIAPERATQLSLRPEVSRVIADAGPTTTPTEDRCGRPLGAAAGPVSPTPAARSDPGSAAPAAP